MSISVDSRRVYHMRGEQIVHGYDEMSFSCEAYTWPNATQLSEVRQREPLVATLGGVCVGRCFLEIEQYPFAELQNLVVAPQYRRRGIGSALVADTTRRAAELGYLAIHLQVDKDNAVAQALYAKHGYLPAQQGERLKMIRFLDYPALELFASWHPLALLSSRRDEAGKLWEMKWDDDMSDDSLSILLSSGSCQGDSDGFGPGVGAFRLQCGETDFWADVSGPDKVSKCKEFSISLKVENNGSTEIKGSCRLLLNAGFAPGQGTNGSGAFRVAAGASQSLDLLVSLTDSFDTDFWKHSCFPSVPICVEVFVGEQVFWLAKQVKP